MKEGGVGLGVGVEVWGEEEHSVSVIILDILQQFNNNINNLYHIIITCETTNPPPTPERNAANSRTF